METQSEINNKQQNFKHSVILNTVSIDELKSQQFNETLVDRSRQRQLFEQKNNKLQHSHHGDTEILESSIHDASVTLNELKQLLKTDTQNKASGADQANSLELKNEGINNDVIEVQIINEQSSQDKQAQNQIENMVSSELEIKKQLSNNYLDAGKKSMNVQDKSNTIDSQNITVNGGQLSTGAIKQSQKNDLRNSKQIWLQEDIFYEKNLKKLGTKVTTKLKGQYQVHKDNVRSSKYKQNFLKATNIINRLLNTSMSRVVKIRQHVQNFVSLLKVRHFNRKADDLSENECQSINDLSHFYFSIEKKRQNKNISTLIDLFDRLSKHLPIFMPTDLYRVIWDMIQVIYIYSFLYIYSLLIFFDQENFNSQQLNNICFYSFINFFADIIINLNTAIFNKDTIIDKRKLIVKQYLFSTVFITDILTMIVLSSRLFQQNHLSVENKKDSLFKYVFNVLVFLKVNGISQKKKRFDYIITLSENQKHVIRLINQIASVMAVAHLAAIGWYFLGVQELKSDQHSWLDKLEISNQAYYQKYVYSIYWAITTMTTVGYGDINATNYIEALYISIAMIVFSCVFAYSINNIGFILQEIEKSSKQLNDDITIIQRYLIRKDVNIQLKSRVRHYLSFLAHEQKDRDKQAEDKILSILSNKLREEITMEINSKILNSYFILSSNFSQATLNKIIFIMEEVLINPNEVIINEKENDDSSIYFIQSGIIEIYQHQIQKQKKVNVIKELRDGQIFGELSFFSGLPRQASARSVNLSTLYKINRDQFIDVLKENVEDFERFKMMQDQIIFQNDLSVIHTECYICQNTGHIAIQCPKTHRIKDQQLIILRHNFSTFQERAEYKRRNKKYFFKAVKNLEICEALKYNLKEQNQDCYLLFKTYDHLFTSENTYSKYYNEDEDYEEDDEDEESLSQIPLYFDDQSIDNNSRNIQRPRQKKKAQTYHKNKKKTNLSFVLNNEEIESQISQDYHFQNSKLLLAQENQDYIKAASNFSAFQINTVPLEPSENQNKKQDPQRKDCFSSQQCKAINKLDSDLANQSQLDNFHPFSTIEDQGSSIVGSSKKLENQKSNMQTSNLQSEHDKRQLKNGTYTIQNASYTNQMSFQSSEDQNKNKNIQIISQNTLENLNRRPSIMVQQRSKNNIPEQSQKYFNQSPKEFKHTIEQMLLNNIMSGDQLCLNQLQQPNIYNNNNNNLGSIQEFLEKSQNAYDKKMRSIKDENCGKGMGSSKNILDQKEKRKSFLVDNSNRFSNQHTKDNLCNSTTNHQGFQPQLHRDNTSSNQQMKFIEGVQKIIQIQNTQLPQLLNMKNRNSSIQINSRDLPITIEQFDKIQFFKKYFPLNNFEKVMLKLKQYKSEQKKIKKNKLASKQRRQNIGLSTNIMVSIFQGNTNLIKFIPQDFNINLYKPTYLSYGVKMQKGSNFPKNFFESSKN